MYSARDLEKLYHDLALSGAACSNPLPQKALRYISTPEILFCEACEATRFDPRLLEIVVHHFGRELLTLNPLQIRLQMQNMQTPQTVGVALEFIKLLRTDVLSRDIVHFITKPLAAVSPQLYYVGVYTKPLSSSILKAIEMPLQEFSRWGFLAHEGVVLKNDFARKTLGTLALPSRLQIIKYLLQTQKQFSIGDYLKALHHQISRQQAFLDLKNCGLVKLIGENKGGKWIAKKQ